MGPALAEVEKLGAIAIPMLQDLLKQPSFQQDYTAHNQWLHFGPQHRQQLKDALSRLQRSIP